MKKKFWTLLAILLLGGAGLSFFLLQKRDLGTRAVMAELNKSVEAGAHMAIKADTVNGNPLAGFTFTNMDLVSEDGTSVAKTPEVKLEMDKIAILKGKFKVKALSFVGGHFDPLKFAGILGHYGQGQGDGWTMPMKINFDDCLFTLNGSSAHIDDLSIKFGDGGLEKGRGHGSFNGLGFDISSTMVRNGDQLKVDNVTFSMPHETTLSFSGTLDRESVNLDGKFSTKDFSFVSTLFPGTRKAHMSGGVDASFSITGTPTNPATYGKVSVSRFSTAGFLFDEGESDWQYGNRVLSFSNMTAKIFGSLVSGKLDIIFQGPLKLNLAMEGKELDVKDWIGPLPWLAFGSGRIDSMDVDLSGSYRRLSGNVSFITSSPTAINDNAFEKLDARIHIKDGKHIRMEGNGIWHGAAVESNGSIDVEKPASRMDITVETKSLDMHQLEKVYPLVDTLGLHGIVAAKATLAGTTQSPEFSGSISSDKVNIKGLTLKDVDFPFHNKGGYTKIEKMKFKWQGSSFKGEVTIKDLTGSSLDGRIGLMSNSMKVFNVLVLKNMSASASFDGNILNVDSLKAALAGGNLNLSGHIDMGNSSTVDIGGKSSGMNASELASQLGISLHARGKADSSFSITGPTDNPEISVTLFSSNLDINGLKIESFKTSLKKRDGKLFIKGMKANLGNSHVMSSGTIDLDEGTGNTLDIRTTVDSMDLSSITEHSFPELSVSGTISADVDIKGKLKSPEFTVTASAGKFSIAGFSFSGLELETLPSEKNSSAIQYMLKTYMGESPLEITGTASLAGDAEPEIDFKGVGKNLDAESFSGKVNGNIKHTVQGTFDLECAGKIRTGKISGKGEIYSPKATVLGYEMNQVNIPFSLGEGRLESKKASAMIYGGTCSMQGFIDPTQKKWGMSLILPGADLSQLSLDFGTLRLANAGKADLQMNLSGVLGKIYLLSGTGTLSVQDGMVGGFDALKSLTKDGILKYRNLNACFNLDGGNVYFLPGSRVSAYSNDNVYKYLSFSGALGGPNTNMNLKCSGRISIKVLSALQGVMQAIVKSSNGEDRSVLLQDFLSGFMGSYSGSDFRNISFELAGTWNKPVLYSLKVESQETAASAIPYDDDDDDSVQKDIKFKVTFPTGEGTSSSSSAGAQFKQQVMENILKQIFIEEDDDKND